MATFPPPTTATFFPKFKGVWLSFLKAFIRFTLVKTSLAEKTPLAFSPLIPMNFGRPAPEPIKTALNPSFSINSSMSTVFPTTTLFSILTPSFFISSISYLTTSFFGNLNSGIP